MIARSKIEPLEETPITKESNNLQVEHKCHKYEIQSLVVAWSQRPLTKASLEVDECQRAVAWSVHRVDNECQSDSATVETGRPIC